MKRIIIAILILVSLAFTACSRNVPMRTSINEYVLMNMTTSNQRGVNFQYNSQLPNQKIPIYRENKTPYTGGGMDFYCDQAGTLKSMLNQYLGNRFHEISTNATFVLELELVDFYVEHYPLDGGAIRAISILAGETSDLSYLNKAVVEVQVRITSPSGVLNKNLIASAEGNATESTMVASLSEVINQANNRILMLLNSYLSENNL